MKQNYTAIEMTLNAIEYAISNADNYYKNGKVNWNYVDTDVYFIVGCQPQEDNPTIGVGSKLVGRAVTDKEIDLAYDIYFNSGFDVPENLLK